MLHTIKWREIPTSREIGQIQNTSTRNTVKTFLEKPQIPRSTSNWYNDIYHATATKIIMFLTIYVYGNLQDQTIEDTNNIAPRIPTNSSKHCQIQLRVITNVHFQFWLPQIAHSVSSKSFTGQVVRNLWNYIYICIWNWGWKSSTLIHKPTKCLIATLVIRSFVTSQKEFHTNPTKWTNLFHTNPTK